MIKSTDGPHLLRHFSLSCLDLQNKKHKHLVNHYIFFYTLHLKEQNHTKKSSTTHGLLYQLFLFLFFLGNYKQKTTKKYCK